VYSIDEAFLDCSGALEDWLTLGTHIKSAIHQWLGLPISIGFGPSKTLAKVANRFAKKSGKGIWVLDSKEAIKEALLRTQVEDIWGIGRQWAKKLRGKGIYTAYDLSQVDPRWMRKVFTVVGERLIRELQGVSCIPLELLQPDKKGLQVSRSFSQPVTSFEGLRQAVATYTSRAAAKLRKAHLKTPSLLVYIRTSPFKPETYYSNSIVVTLDQAANDTPSLIEAACKGLEYIFKPKPPYQKAGVMALDLIHESATQLQLGLTSPTLFSKTPLNPQEKVARTLKYKTISKTLDQINKRYGQETVLIASCGIKPKWKMRSEYKTPSYTTSWNELAKVKAL
jgi:DNA polymerase V